MQHCLFLYSLDHRK